MRIVVDAMGGDFAPKVNVDGSIDALREFPEVEITLVGPQELVEKTIGEYADQQALSGVRGRLSVVDAPEVITTEEHPVMALRRKKNSTFCIGMDIVRRKEAQAFVSAGSTGALMAGAMFKIGRIKGVARPALATLLPVPNRPMLMVDAGANVDCKPDWIVQFSMMGSVYMQKVMGIETPDVGLLNIGEEETKGSQFAQDCHMLLKEQLPGFAGNAEGKDIALGGFDVIVTDGFTGNVALKTYEGVGKALLGALKESLMGSLKTKIGALLIKPALKELMSKVSADEYGGAQLLGVKGVCLIGHGNSDAHAVCSGVLATAAAIRMGMPAKLAAAIGEAE